ncbi:CPBP family intramembrane glutamic endopeptidase [Flammeovirga kamogawensis]|uniref:CPBP family intramembrane metalloprotease n=1 Tax=Flammeovirga kamogawensis TaxID=373891 RepID=A0ABX8GRI9_9BACT|nr:type II CAAX endopeptidase family protein [Flammeovirga kamogawensis]MBB6463689.1 membrane protease YdiL (CAAX protease family) [Flammeovirga kamogawensis]QWG06189.1 CPBP family intramembrane metalloprotease [Flammeovirga kamogawensis]TRX68020.1 CPBP family intramembrane metalloprotease [Flammeovirga kamogawensis]
MNTDLKYASVFAILTLIISYVFTFFIFFDGENINLVSLVMFVPAIIGLLLNSIRYKSFKKVFAPVFHRLNLKALAFSVLYPILFIGVICLVTYALGLSTLNKDKLIELTVLPGIANVLIGLLLVFGEEYGWRGFLLKTAAAAHGKNFAAIGVGIIWALWHAPIVLELAFLTNVEYPFVLMLLQLCAVFIFSMPFAYAYFKSDSIIPPIIFHYVWNYFNPILLGSVYFNQTGIFEGNITLINGEGLAGVLLGIPFFLWFLKTNSTKEIVE